jgi:hypothetical protein
MLSRSCARRDFGLDSNFRFRDVRALIRVAEGRAASNIWSRLGRVCGTNHTDRGCRDGGHFEIEHIRIGDGEMDPACGKSLLRQSSTATDRFRNLTPAIGPRPWERVFMPHSGHCLDPSWSPSGVVRSGHSPEPVIVTEVWFQTDDKRAARPHHARAISFSTAPRAANRRGSPLVSASGSRVPRF